MSSYLRVAAVPLPLSRCAMAKPCTVVCCSASRTVNRERVHAVVLLPHSRCAMTSNICRLQDASQDANCRPTCERVHAVRGGAIAAVALRNEAREAADAVTTHFRLGTVRVEDAHAVVHVALRRQRKDDLQAIRGCAC